MRAILINRFGGPEVLEMGEAPTPAPGLGEVLLKVKACALNHLDIWVRDGIPSYHIKLPHILGCDVAGEVAALGKNVSCVKIGQRAAVSPGRSCRNCQECLSGQDNHCRRYGVIGAHGGPGGYAQYLAVPEDYLLPVPDSMDFAHAAAFPLTFQTAWHMLMTHGGCGPGQCVLVLGAGSGVGVAAIEIAKLAGARVLAASTSEAKLEKAKALGADETILLPKQDLVKETRRATGGAMADIVFEHVGQAVFDAALKSLKPGGRIVTCGATTGPDITVDFRYVFSRELRIQGSMMGTQSEMRLVAQLVSEGRLKPVVDKTFALDDARAAHEYLAGKNQFGKVVLLP
ncbi:MAG TPA: zinc-binding dehydrogenase [Elusimicrobiota bacterium]|nr:zinc-binding dehydrogenase [Elusimicrobiota bacterium]